VIYVAMNEKMASRAFAKVCFASGILLASMIYFYQNRGLYPSLGLTFFSIPLPIERKVMCASQ